MNFYLSAIENDSRLTFGEGHAIRSHGDGRFTKGHQPVDNLGEGLLGVESLRGSVFRLNGLINRLDESGFGVHLHQITESDRGSVGVEHTNHPAAIHRHAHLTSSDSSSGLANAGGSDLTSVAHVGASGYSSTGALLSRLSGTCSCHCYFVTFFLRITIGNFYSN